MNSGGGGKAGFNLKSAMLCRIGVQGPAGAVAHSTLYWKGLAIRTSPRRYAMGAKQSPPAPAGLLSAGVGPGGKLGPAARAVGSICDVGMKPTSVISGGGGQSNSQIRRHR